MKGCREVVKHSDPIQLLLSQHLGICHNCVQKADLQYKLSHRGDGSLLRFPQSFLQTEMGYYTIN